MRHPESSPSPSLAVNRYRLVFMHRRRSKNSKNSADIISAADANVGEVIPTGEKER